MEQTVEELAKCFCLSSARTGRCGGMRPFNERSDGRKDLD